MPEQENNLENHTETLKPNEIKTQTSVDAKITKTPLFYELKIDLKKGTNLAIRDRSGILLKFLNYQIFQTK